jgi:hypothetical protein
MALIDIDGNAVALERAGNGKPGRACTDDAYSLVCVARCHGSNLMIRQRLERRGFACGSRAWRNLGLSCALDGHAN